MKIKKYRKVAREEMKKALHDNVRAIFTMLCKLHWRERFRIAWLLIKGDSNIQKAVKS